MWHNIWGVYYTDGITYKIALLHNGVALLYCFVFPLMLSGRIMWLQSRICDDNITVITNIMEFKLINKECLYITIGKSSLAAIMFFVFFLDKYKDRERARCCDS